MPNIPVTPCIYAIRCKDNDKLYVGSAADFKKRWRMHRDQLAAGKHHSPHLQRAWLKHGPDRFVFEILESIPNRGDLIAAEQSWIDTTRSFQGEFGYNASPTAGSTLGMKHSPEAKARNAEAQRKRFSDPAERERLGSIRRGTKLTPEHRAKIGAASKGRRHSPESIASMIAKQKGRPKNPESIAKMAESLRGRKLSEEHKAKVSAAGMGRRHTPESKAKISNYRRGTTVGAEMRSHLSEMATKQWSTPEARKRMSEIKKATYRPRPPEEEERRLAAFRATIAKRKASKASDCPSLVNVR